MTIKTCSCCGRTSAAVPFNPSQNYCKPCMAEYTRNWRASRPGYMGNKLATHRVTKLNVETTACEIERAAIADLYTLAARIKAATGDDWHVDHIVPLIRGGEHRLSNLRIIPATLNSAKHYKLDSECTHELRCMIAENSINSSHQW